MQVLNYSLCAGYMYHWTVQGPAVCFYNSEDYWVKADTSCYSHEYAHQQTGPYGVQAGADGCRDLQINVSTIWDGSTSTTREGTSTAGEGCFGCFSTTRKDCCSPTREVRSCAPSSTGCTCVSSCSIYSSHTYPSIWVTFSTVVRKSTLIHWGYTSWKQLPWLFRSKGVMRLRNNSTLRKNFAAQIVRSIFTKEERSISNVNGSRNNAQLDPLRISFVKQKVFLMYPLQPGEKTDKAWAVCVGAIDEANRRLNRQNN